MGVDGKLGPVSAVPDRNRITSFTGPSQVGEPQPAAHAGVTQPAGGAGCWQRTITRSFLTACIVAGRWGLAAPHGLSGQPGPGVGWS